jgi:hypothetical protein
MASIPSTPFLRPARRGNGGGCVLERAFEDLGVLIVDYRQAHGRGFSFDHGLGDFVREFDANRFPSLLAAK